MNDCLCMKTNIKYNLNSQLQTPQTLKGKKYLPLPSKHITFQPSFSSFTYSFFLGPSTKILYGLMEYGYLIIFGKHFCYLNKSPQPYKIPISNT